MLRGLNDASSGFLNSSSAALRCGLGALHVRFDPRDFGLERLDPLLELVDRQRAEVLLDRAAVSGSSGWLEKKSSSVHERESLTRAAAKSIRPRPLGTSMHIIPDVMRVVEIAAPGGPEQLRLVERPVPRPGPGEVLVKVAAAGVNRPDILQRNGLYPPPPGASDIPGLEIAGEVVAAGRAPTT